jgi:hypothetical protein
MCILESSSGEPDWQHARRSRQYEECDHFPWKVVLVYEERSGTPRRGSFPKILVTLKSSEQIVARGACKWRGGLCCTIISISCTFRCPDTTTYCGNRPLIGSGVVASFHPRFKALLCRTRRLCGPTTGCSRPLRAQDRCYFEAFSCSALAAAEP